MTGSTFRARVPRRHITHAHPTGPRTGCDATGPTGGA